MTDTLERFDLAPGFRATATACGLRPSGELDLALVSSASPCTAAGTFTTNHVRAAPVLYDEEILARHAANIRAVIANSGCANACTGDQGTRDVRHTAAMVAQRLGCRPDQVLALSTGVIGRPLDMEKITKGIAKVADSAARASAADAARAILTTDTRPKIAMRETARGVAVRGFAKGSGMIHPHLATMLGIVTTDARLAPDALQSALRFAVARSFNRISVDGDMSTNDTVLLLASGVSEVEIRGTDLEDFAETLTEVCISLAKQIARDGEGATRLVEILVTGAIDEPQAHAVADQIARSPLVKTAIHGGDPNWGRVLAAAGSSGVAIDPERLTLCFGAPPEEACVVSSGLPTTVDERHAAEKLKADPVRLRLDLGLGGASCAVWTCDLSGRYVDLNAHYTT